MPDLLIELLSEEIPARMQARAADDLKRLVTGGLAEAGLAHAGAAAFATPRRLCLAVEGLPERSPAAREERKGPRADAPDKAIEGFLRGAGLARDQAETRDGVLFAVIEKPGRPAADIVAEALGQAIRSFPWPKSMRWGSGALKWVRPLRSILCILADEAGHRVVPGEVGGIAFGDTTEGHRFMAPGRFPVASFEDYERKLSRARVVLDASRRAESIRADAASAAFASGLEVIEDEGLLAEIAGLVEWPVVLMGRIGDDFLDLPPEVLRASMRGHQKFLSARDPGTGRIERFIAVANRETADDGATILAGNERVLRARLADAKFFWENDLRVARSGMAAWTRSLEGATFHNKLGSQADRVGRVAALARGLAPAAGADAALAGEAARLAKADLGSEMVREFPELQGLMGRHYIEAAGRPAEVAAAAEEHYSPLGPSDGVPSAPVSVAVALADKLDTLAGFWAIDEKPTGSKDPFALRRAALGVIRLVLDNDLSVPLLPVLEGWPEIFLDPAREPGRAAGGNGDAAVSREAFPARAADLLAFIHDRLKVHLRDRGVRHDAIDACLAMPGSDDLALLAARARALSETLATDDGENLIQGFRRANNILAQAEEADGEEYRGGADPALALEPPEAALLEALDAAEAGIAPAIRARDFAAAMSAMAALRGPVDAFFAAVQVNAGDAAIRRNRLRLLGRARALCLSVADLSKVEG